MIELLFITFCIVALTALWVPEPIANEPFHPALFVDEAQR
jgi:hypothetical protein